MASASLRMATLPNNTTDIKKDVEEEEEDQA